MNNRSTSTRIVSLLLLVALIIACSPQTSTLPPSDNLQLGVSASMPSAAFVPNPGIASAAILFRTLGAAGTLFFEQHQVIFPLPSRSVVHPWFSRLMEASASDASRAAQLSAVRLQFIGANPDTRVVGQERLPGIVNYFLGNDPNNWKASIPTFGSITYQELFPGIDLVYNGGEGVLKGTYLVAPGANPGSIRWRYEGASRVELSKGELLIGADETGENPLLVEHKPVAWQTAAGQRTAVHVQYVVHPDSSIGFTLGAYDVTQPLVIDPTLDYGTYWGGVGCDGAYHMAVDSSNKVYITGPTNSQDYPHPDSFCDQNEYYNVFITKLDPSKVGANQHIYTTYIGGSAYDVTSGIGVDNAGKAYVAGFTASLDLPFTTNAYQKIHRGGYADGMVILLNTTGALQYLSYLGGTDFEELMQVSVSGGLIHVVGFTDSSDFPITAASAYDSILANRDTFVSVLDTSKSGNASLVYSTFYGGPDADEGYAIAVNNGIIYFAGTTNSATGFPLKNPVQSTFGGGGGYGDVFAAKLDRSLSGTNQLLFATYLGGSDDEIPGGVVPSGTQNMYVAGATGSSNFPTTLGPSLGGVSDAFLAKLDVVAPTNLVYSRFIGGNGKDGIRDVQVDSLDNTYVAGYTGSSNLQTIDPLQATFKGGEALSTDSWWFYSRDEIDAMVVKCSPAGALTFSTFLGGTGAEGAFGLRIGVNGTVYVAGGTRSTDFSTANPYQAANAGQYDAFVVGIGGLAPASNLWLYLPIIKR